MLRRTVLTTVAACVSSLAGCSRDGTGRDGGRTGPRPTETPRSSEERPTTSETTMASELQRTVTLADQSDATLRETFGVGADVSVLESSVTTAHTARIRISLENHTETSQTLTYTRDTCDLNLIWSRPRPDDGARLLLVSTEQAWEPAAADCWVPDGRNLDCGIPAREHRVTVAPEEPLEWTFRLWTVPKTYAGGRCMPLGAHRFARTLRREESEAALSFTLALDST
jgi:hypothetical protein